jgi:probable HAF family extracellular repeat protein
VTGVSALTGSSAGHAFFYNNGTMTDLGTLPGGTSSAGAAINNFNEIAGFSSTASGVQDAVVFDRGSILDIGALNGQNSVGLAINNKGIVVGEGAADAFIWSGLGQPLTDLNTLINPSSGWHLSEATGINDAGQITGTGSINGQTHAFLLTPVIQGDTNGDGIVNGQDVSIMASNWLQTGINLPGDANGDGIVNGQDIALAASNWLQTFNGGGGATSNASVPEPGSMALVGIAVGLFVLARASRRLSARPIRCAFLSWCCAGGVVVTTIILASTVSAQDTITSLGTFGSGDFGANGPFGVAVGPTGTVYVTDNSRGNIEYFSPSGTLENEFGGSGSNAGEFNSIAGVAVSPSGTVYAVDQDNHRIETFSSTGTFITQWGSFGTGASQFTLPTDVAISPSGNVYVTDTAGYRVQEFTPTGAPVTQWGSQGTTTGSFESPYFLATTSAGNVLVTDPTTGLVQTFSGAGVFQNASIVPGATGVAVSANGDAYVVNTTTQSVTKYDSSGNVLTAFGSFGNGSQQFNDPLGIAVAPTGNIYIADSFNLRVDHYFDPDAWVSGTNSFTNVAVGSGQLLGTAQTLFVGKTLNVSGTTTQGDCATLGNLAYFGNAVHLAAR